MSASHGFKEASFIIAIKTQYAYERYVQMNYMDRLEKTQAKKIN